MPNVFVLAHFDYEEFTILGIFDDRTKARKEAENMPGLKGHKVTWTQQSDGSLVYQPGVKKDEFAIAGYSIEEYEVNRVQCRL